MYRNLLLDESIYVFENTDVVNLDFIFLLIDFIKREKERERQTDRHQFVLLIYAFIG